MSLYVKECLVQLSPTRGAGSDHCCLGSRIGALFYHPAGHLCPHTLGWGFSMEPANPLWSEVCLLLMLVPSSIPPAQVLMLSVVGNRQATPGLGSLPEQTGQDGSCSARIYTVMVYITTALLLWGSCESDWANTVQTWLCACGAASPSHSTVPAVLAMAGGCDEG